MSAVTMKELLEAGVHFGHETKRWDPKMKPYIFGARNGIYIIDLQKTVQLFKEAYQFVRDIAAKRRIYPLCRDKKTGPGDDLRAGHPLWNVLCESSLVGRYDDQFPDH